ncbi:MAG: MarR family transcriptional regulator [Minisyncoccia bacterium]
MKVFYKIHQFMLALERSLQRELAQNCPQVTFSQFMFLLVIQKHPESSQKIIADARQLTPAAISRQIEILIKKGWVVREKTSYSKREYILSLTPQGKKLLEQAKKVLDKQRNRIFEDVDYKELDQVEKIIDKWLKKIIGDNIKTK